MSHDALTESVLALAGTLEARLGPPGLDPSLSHVPVGTDPLVHQLVYSMMLWESSHAMAEACMEAVRGAVVDLNELRVCTVDELCEILPKACPGKEERAMRLLGALNDVFVREHALSLAALGAVPKREARQYLDALAGLPQFAAARVVLVSLGGHALPVDGRIAGVLGAAGVPDAENPDALGARLERAVRAADAPRVYALLEAEASANPPKARSTKPRRKAPAEKTDRNPA